MLQHMTLAFDDLLKARRKAFRKDQVSFCSLMLLLAIYYIYNIWVHPLNDKGLAAAYVHTETRNDEEKLERVRSCHISLFFISPA